MSLRFRQHISSIASQGARLMSRHWPAEIEHLEAFLAAAGLIRVHREESDLLSNKLLEYEDRSIGVRAVCDRGVWIIEVADQTSNPKEWYDAGLVRSLLVGSEGGWSLPEQIMTVESNWKAIIEGFSDTKRTQTHARLAALGEERVRRLLSGRGTLRDPQS
jgi:hypothetical protein